jgi:dihydrofolate reductase
MIYAVVAIDDNRGIADNKGIPWDLPTDRKYFRDKVRDKNILMGYGTYREISPFSHTKSNLVATSRSFPETGFISVKNAHKYLQKSQEDIWVIGGAGLFANVWNKIEILYLTKVEGDFNCTKFLPEYEHDFDLTEQYPPIKENSITFHYEVWTRKSSK